MLTLWYGFNFVSFLKPTSYNDGESNFLIFSISSFLIGIFSLPIKTQVLFYVIIIFIYFLQLIYNNIKTIYVLINKYIKKDNQKPYLVRI